MTTRQNGRPAATTPLRSRPLLSAVLWTSLCLSTATALAAPSATRTSTSAIPPAATAHAALEVEAAPGDGAPTFDPTAASPTTAAALPAAGPAPSTSTPPVAAQPQADLPATQADSETTGRIRSLLDKALTLLGTPYRWGGNDPDKGFDCSGLVGYVFRTTLGIELPRVSRDMARNGQPITDRAKLAAGDLVFFGLKGRVNHVGIYLGNGQFLHAPSRGKDVSVSSLEKGYWSGRFLQARRVDAHDGS